MRCEVPITCQGGISDSNLTLFPPACPHAAGSVPGCVWPCSACGGCDPSFSIEHPYTGSGMAKVFFQLKQGCCNCVSVWKVEVQTWMLLCPISFLPAFGLGQARPLGQGWVLARLQAEPGLHCKACVPSSLLQSLCPDCRSWKYFQSLK